MEVAFRLAAREAPARADALYVPGDLRAMASRLGDAWPEVFAVAGGFLVVPRESPKRPIPGTIPLRRIAGDLFVPADADLIPGLRPDEAVGLTRTRGWLVLADGVHGFEPASPIPESAMFSLGPIRRDAWEPFPPRPATVDRLHAIRRPEDESGVVAILESGSPTDANPLTGNGSIPEDARPAGGSLGSRASAGAKLAAGQFLNWLGRSLGAAGLAAAGANLARRALEQVPRLSERVLGEQEAALRELLRQFRAGDIERALRRAPVAVPDPNAPPSRVDAGSQLANHDARYSLRDLLTSGSGGGGAAWLGGGDVWAQLAAEYRKLAEEAIRKGDIRRAAYIFGVLLRDPRQAAVVLDTGGLHRDAALIYRDKLHDKSAAAAAYERGGCWDEAVELYQELGHHEKAGDLLRKIGDETAALAMYAAASEKLASNGRYRAAGDLARTKAGNLPAAHGYYRKGWDAGTADALPCGERLVDDAVAVAAWDDLHEIVGDAEARLGPPRTDDAGRFFGHVTEAVAKSAPQPVRDDFCDRTRLALAAHLRAASRGAGNVTHAVSAAFGGHSIWPAPVVRDAREAARRESAPKAKAIPATTPYSTVKLVNSAVTAAVVARGSFDLVVASEAGELAVLDGTTAEVTPVPNGLRGTPTAIACGPIATALVVMTVFEMTVFLNGYQKQIDGSGWNAWEGERVGSADDGVPYLMPELEVAVRSERVRIYCFDSIRAYRAPMLRADSTIPRVLGIRTSFVASCETTHWSRNLDNLLCDGPTGFDDPVAATLPWFPEIPSGSSLIVAAVDYITPADGTLELAGIADGAVYWSEAKRDGDVLRTATATASCSAGYQAACLIRPGLLAAVTGENEVHWLRADGSPTLRRWGPTRRISHPARAVYLAHRPAANEVVVVLFDGTAVRVPKP